MKVVFTDNTELSPILISGGPRFIQGAQRDSLEFVFPEMSLDLLKTHFTENNCEEIRIVDNEGGEYIHSGYVILSELAEKTTEIQNEIFGEAPSYEKRVHVIMGQRTYQEKEILSLKQEIENIKISLNLNDKDITLN